MLRHASIRAPPHCGIDRPRRYHACVTAREKSGLVKRLAADLGFDGCGIAEAGPIGRSDYLRDWLDAGRAGSMDYLHRYFSERTDPRNLVPGAQSVIMVARLYHQAPKPHPVPADRPQGRVAMYAWGDDYHDVLRPKLRELVVGMRESVAEPFDAKVCVDTVPLLERELAARAGIGWIGKNTLVLNERQGSYFFLGAVVTTLELAPDEPLIDHCGTCTACLDACPTDAFVAPYQMDASRCISYLTIEHRGDISKAFQDMMGDWVFGCDVCQEVCPHNRSAPVTDEPRFVSRPPAPTVALDELRHWSPEDHRRMLRGRSMNRAKPDMLKRNAGVAAANLSKVPHGRPERNVNHECQTDRRSV